MPEKAGGEKKKGMKTVSWGSTRPGPEDEKVGYIWEPVHHVDNADVIVRWERVPDADFVMPMGGVPRGDLED